jgi:uncharacterized membrane protein
MRDHHRRFLKPHEHLARPFGDGGFGQKAEAFARLFGTPKFLIGQTMVVGVWIAINAAKIVHFDIYPFILLNLAFSLQAAYAAPLILLAQTRQADRDKAHADADAQHREEVATNTMALINANTALTQAVADLTKQVHDHVCVPQAERLPSSRRTKPVP